MKRKINVMVSATYSLTQSCLMSSLKTDPEIKITGKAASHSELLKKVLDKQPDVVLLCLMDDEDPRLQVIGELYEIAPQTRVVLILAPNSRCDQREALRKGVAGIITMNQSDQVMIKAIKQVADGETWLSQKLMTVLLGETAVSAKQKNSIDVKSNDLTKREYEIIDVILQGMSNRQISKTLFISQATVRHHLSSIYSKLYIDDRLNLVIYAYQNGLASKQP